MQTYREAILRFDPADREEIEDCLARWALSDDRGAFIVKNIREHEHFLPPSRLEALFRALLLLPEKTPAALAAAYGGLCHPHVLQGGDVPDSAQAAIEILGRAVEREYFTKWLFRVHGPDAKAPCAAIFFSIDEAEDFVVRFMLGHSFKGDDLLVFANVYGAWVTWSDLVNDPAPFSFVQYSQADEVRACLGLDPLLDGELLLLSYVREPLRLVRPTICDAGLFPFFEPPAFDFHVHGWTKPWHAEHLKKRASSAKLPLDFRPKARPEALHRSMELSRVSVPPERLR